MDLRQEMVQGEGEVAESAAEVDRFERPFGGEVFVDVVDEFEVTIDLPELMLSGFLDSTVGGHDAEGDEKRAGDACGDEVLFLAVVAGRLVGGAFGRN